MMVGDRQAAGTWDFIWSLPVPRSAAVASTFTVFTVLSVPGIMVTLALAAWRYGLTCTRRRWRSPRCCFRSLMATAVGFAMAQVIATRW